MAMSDGEEPALRRLDFVGQGSQGRVDRVVVESTGQEAVLKTFFRSHGACEAHVMLTLDSPFVPRLIHHWFKCRDTGFVLMEDCGTALFDAFESGAVLNDSDTRLVLWSVASALECAHNHGWAHNDVKALNVCRQPVVDAGDAAIYRRAGVQPMRVRLVDWGAATALGWCDDRRRGTRGYTAPENADLTHGGTVANDTWMLGCLLLEIVERGNFWCDHPSDVLKTWLPNAIWDCRQNGRLPLANLLQRLLEERTELRLGARKGLVAELLEHPYFSGLSETDWANECDLRAHLTTPKSSGMAHPERRKRPWIPE